MQPLKLQKYLGQTFRVSPNETQIQEEEKTVTHRTDTAKMRERIAVYIALVLATLWQCLTTKVDNYSYSILLAQVGLVTIVNNSSESVKCIVTTWANK